MWFLFWEGSPGRRLWIAERMPWCGKGFLAVGLGFFADWQPVRFGLADQLPVIQLVFSQAGKVSARYTQRVSK